MSTPHMVISELPLSVPEPIRSNHAQLPNSVLVQMGEQVNRYLLELSLIEQYKRAEIYLSDVSKALGHYPNVQQTMKWLGTQGINLGPSPDQYELIDNNMKQVLAERRAYLASQSQA